MSKEERAIHSMVVNAIRQAHMAHPDMSLRDAGDAVSKRVRRNVMEYYRECKYIRKDDA